jgi:hypothetical protein
MPYLPRLYGRVASGWFILDMDPDAPHEVLVEDKPSVRARAVDYASSGVAIPVFVKETRKARYQYVGIYKAREHWTKTSHPREVAQRENSLKGTSGERAIYSVLILERLNNDRKELETRKHLLISY